MRTSGPSATAGSFGSAIRGSGTSTAYTALPSGAQSSDVVSTGSAARPVRRRDEPDFASATYRYDASSKLARNAIRDPSGDQVGDDAVAPAGISSFVFAPVCASTISIADSPRVVNCRARLARVSTCRPPRYTWALPNFRLTPNPSLCVARKCRLSGLCCASVALSWRGAVTSRATSGGGVTKCSCASRARSASTDCCAASACGTAITSAPAAYHSRTCARERKRVMRELQGSWRGGTGPDT